MPDPESVPDATTKHHFTGAGKPYEADTFNLNITVNAHVEVAGTDHANEALKATAAAAMQESDRKARGALSNIATTERTRVDSAQNSAESVPQLPSEKRPEPNGPDLVGRDIAVGPHASTLPPEDTIANSPTLSKHTIKLDGGAVNTLPAVQPTSPVTEEAQSLPSFRQLTGQLAPLTELAEAATQQDHRGLPKSRQHRQSHGSAASQSPIMTFLPPFPSTAQSPPASHQPHGHRSPSGNVNDGQSHGSPRPMTTYYTSQRRTSGLDVPPVQLPAIPSLPSNSSSGESYGHHSSGTEGYSTTQTTPFEGSMPPEGANRPILPPPPGLSVVPIGNFQCDYPGCNASPFQTQYLLRYNKTFPNALCDANSVKLTQERPLKRSDPLLPCERLSPQRGWKGFQA